MPVQNATNVLGTDRGTKNKSPYVRQGCERFRARRGKGTIKKNNFSYLGAHSAKKKLKHVETLTNLFCLVLTCKLNRGFYVKLSRRKLESCDSFFVLPIEKNGG